MREILFRGKSVSNNERWQMKNRELKPCPKCGKLPKIIRDYNYEHSGFGAWCTIQCKPFLRKPHLKIEEGKASWDRALKYGIEQWNRRVGNDD